MLSVLAFFITTLTYLLANKFIVLSIIRLIHGLSFGIVTTVTGAIVADLLPASRRGEGMGYFAMSMNLAVVIGPFIGLLLLQHIFFKGLFIVLSILMAFAFVFAILVQTEEAKEQKQGVTFSIEWSDLIEIKAFPIALVGGMVGFSYGSILSFVPVYAEAINLAPVASYFFLVFAVVMIIFRPYLGRAFDERGPRIVLVPSLFVFGAGLFLLSMTKTAVIFLFAAAVIGLGYGTILPGFQTIAVEKSGPKRTSQAMSTFFTLYDLGIALGAFTWGVISTNYSFETMYLISAIVVFIMMFIFNHYMGKTN